jgi:flagellar hook-associated protein 3 FlgL
MIRVATSNLYATGYQGISADQQALATTVAQLSSGKQINSPADNPAGAAQASSLQSDLSQLSQYQSNQSQATHLLNMGSSTLGQVVNVIQGIRQTLVQAGDPTYSDSQRGAMAAQLQQQLNQLVGLANTGDGQGGYLFAGSTSSQAPFQQLGNTVAYSGDNIVQGLQISANRTEQVKYSGADVFNNVPTGNGSFVTAATGTNTGTGTISGGSVATPSQLTGDQYTITMGAGGGSYSVFDSTRGVAVPGQQNVAFASPGPASISFDGMTMQLSGAPAAGDSFTVAPSGYQSLFQTVATAITALQTPTTSAAVASQRSATLSGLLGATDQALTHISGLQSTLGAQLGELNSYSAINGDRTLQDQTQLSAIVDLDYAKAVSTMQRQQTQYQAALQSYSAISKLSLFNYL